MVVARAWAFQDGQTMVSVRLRDVDGNPGPVSHFIIDRRHAPATPVQGGADAQPDRPEAETMKTTLVRSLVLIARRRRSPAAAAATKKDERAAAAPAAPAPRRRRRPAAAAPQAHRRTGARRATRRRRESTASSSSMPSPTSAPRR